jgi:V8-like Glu-specific endopeptidase
MGPQRAQASTTAAAAAGHRSFLAHAAARVRLSNPIACINVTQDRVLRRGSRLFSPTSTTTPTMRFPLLVAGLLGSAVALMAQETTGSVPMSMRLGLDLHAIPTLSAAPFDATGAALDDAKRAAEGRLPLYGRYVAGEAAMNTHGQWMDLADGSRLWRLRVHSAGAKAMELLFDATYLPPDAQVHIYSEDGTQVHGGYTAAHVQDDGYFSTDMVFGESTIVEYHEPAQVRGEGALHLARIVHAYRMVDALTGACEVDVNCSEGADWTNQRDAVMRIRVVGTTGTGFCSGTLVNNTNLDCKPYILTANHCTEDSDASHWSQYIFRFRYQRTSCNSGSATGLNMTGCQYRASSMDSGGNSGSDYTLLELNAAIPPGYTPYWAGWDASGATSTGGVCIHHPDSDVKKISTFTGTTSSTSWGTASGSHWRVVWSATANGYGVTEGGSSGSPIFNSAKRIVGTLTGGGSCCTANGCGTGTSPTSPDYFGKMSFHFGSSNPNTAAERLRNWLAPGSTANTLDGSANPCAVTGMGEQSDVVLLEVFPNPAQGAFTVRLPEALRVADRVEVRDVTGRLVHAQRISGLSVQIDAGPWSPGGYMVSVMQDGALKGRVHLMH